MDVEINQLLADYKYNFKVSEHQLQAIETVMKGKDTLVTLPTGYGKSLCYIIPPLLYKRRTDMQSTAIVVSPLKSIMAEQRATLLEKGIKAAMLVHGEDMKEGDKERIMAGDVDIIFTSPEAGLSWIKMFSGDSFQKQCCLIAFDECHCVSEWGLDFRPKYRESASLASILDVPILCLTATITINIYKDIKKVLRLREPALIRVIPDRPEIHIQVIKPRSQFDDELTWMLDLIKN